MTIISYALVGLTIGWLGTQLMEQQSSPMSDIFIGIIGAILGCIVFYLFDPEPYR
jgi:uncharacterized membrane protein YeaQ/YmgE (transglycosylase-associated protein family)